MDAAERALLEDSIGSALCDARANADAVLAELGWYEMLDTAPRDAIEVVFDALGRTNASAAVLDDVLASALGFTPRPDLAVLLPRFGTWQPPNGVGLATSRVVTARELLVMGNDGGALVPASSLQVRAIGGVDPDAGWHEVRVHHEHVTIDAGRWDSALALGRRALAQQMAGATRAMLDLARVHALARVQFGRPIARFQAVRHRLADTLVAIEALDATLAAAGDEPNGLTAALAKAAAGRAARTVAAHCQQVLAGIGFTTDHPFHRFLKRTTMLDGVLGSADDIVFDVGRQLLADRHVPTLIEL